MTTSETALEGESLLQCLEAEVKRVRDENLALRAALVDVQTALESTPANAPAEVSALVSRLKAIDTISGTSATVPELPVIAAELSTQTQLKSRPTACEDHESLPLHQSCTRCVAPHGLSAAQVMRYGRQMLVPQIGAQGQEKLNNASVLVIGAGGLGSPAILYLAAAGIGLLGIADKDDVDLSNLHRQVVHCEASVGVPKVRSAEDACRRLNSTVRVVTHNQGLSQANALELVGAYDVVLDCSDNPATRYLVSDACALRGRPLVSGAAVAMEGQLSVYNTKAGTPCYRCVFPAAQQPENCQRCADSGVLGVVPGTIGTLQAMEAIKMITEVGKVLSGKLLVFDAGFTSFHTIKLRDADPACVVCGDNPTITEASLQFYDYKKFAGGFDHDRGPESAPATVPAEWRVSPQELEAMLVGGDANPSQSQLETSSAARKFVLLDVRPAHQFEFAALPGAHNVPYEDFAIRMEEMKRLARSAQDDEHTSSVPVFVVCRRGNDSQLAVRDLFANGFKSVKDVEGGLEAWRLKVDPTWPSY